MKRDEAKAVIAAIVAMRETATDEQALAASALYPKWSGGREYKDGERVLHDGVLYKVLQGHTAQSNWTPDVAPSLFAKVLTSDDGTPLEWEPPEATNPYMAGDKVTYNGCTWESLIDYNVWEPTEANATLWAKV